MPIFGGAIESILSQTFQDFEILLIDDGSTDGSGIICDELKSLDSRIRVFHIQNSGPSVARNLGLEHANGKFIYCMDSDDYLENVTFEKIVEEMEKGYDMVSFNLVREDEQANVLWHSGYKSQIFGFPSLDERLFFLFSQFLCYCFGWENPTRFFRRDIIERYKIRYPIKSRIGEDMCFCFCYMLHVSSYIILENEYYHYVKHTGTLLDKAKHKNNVHDFEQMLLHVIEHIKVSAPDVERYIPLILMSFLEMEISRFRNAGFSDKKIGKIVNASLSNESIELLRAFVSDPKLYGILTRQQCGLYKYDSILCISNGSLIKSLPQWFKMKFYNVMEIINRMFI